MFKDEGSRRSAKFGANSIMVFFIFVAVLSILNFISARHEFRFDFSDAGIFSLSDQSVRIVENLKEPVVITGFFSSQSKAKDRAEDLFKNYSYLSEHLTIRIVDPDKKPVLAKQYNVRDYDTVVVEMAGKTAIARSITEDGVTTALIRVSRTSEKTFYFVTGHGEHRLDDAQQEGLSILGRTMQKQGFVIKSLNLLSEKEIPADADVVIIAGPRRVFAETEKAQLRAYLAQKGQLLLLIDPTLDAQNETGLEDFTAEYGVNLENGLILDPSSGRVTIPTISPGAYLSHPVTEGFDLATFFPVSRGVFLNPKMAPEFRYDPILETGPEAWLTTELSGDLSVDPERDQRGPISFGGVFYKNTGIPEVLDQTKAPKMRFVVLGDSDFATNSAINKAGNGDLFLNMVSWLANEGDLISIRAKELPTAALLLSKKQINTLFFVSVLMLPLGVMGLGLLIWRGRRKL